MPRVYLFFLTMLLSAATASAQTTFRLGLRGGGNRAASTLAATSNSTGNYPFNFSADKSAIYAWQAGAVLEVAFRKFALQPALLFSQKGERSNTIGYISGVAGMSGEERRSTNRYNWLEFPLNAVYTTHGFQVFAGPYVAVAVGGRQRGTSYGFSPFVRYAPYSFNDEVRYGSNTDFRRLDMGVNFGLGYRQGPLQVQLGYGLGLRNLRQTDATQFYDYGHNFNRDAAYNRVAQLTGTYFFEL